MSGRGFIGLVCAFGALFLTAILALTVYVCLVLGEPFFPRGEQGAAQVFASRLREADDFFKAGLSAPERMRPRSFDARLDALERSAFSAEAQLSVLKRRRMLARRFPSFIPAYLAAAERQTAAFPQSPALAALAADALLLEAAAREDAQRQLPDTGKLEALAGVITEAASAQDNALFQAAYILYALAGEFATPRTAAALPRIRQTFERAATAYAIASTGGSGGDAEKGGGLETAAINGSLLALTSNDVSGALKLFSLLDMQRIGAEADSARLPEKTLEYAAAFAYDFGDPLAASPLFLRLGGGRNMARAADALYLAGNLTGARSLWFNVTTSGAGEGSPEALGLRLQSRYNLAVTAETDAEKTRVLTALFVDASNAGVSGTLPSNRAAADSIIYGMIRYTRLLDHGRAVAILRESPLLDSQAVLDLELFRQTLVDKPIDRTIAETWLLLARHPDEEALYEWAAWYFDYNHAWGEGDFLLKKAAQNKMGGSRLRFHEALRAIRSGDTTAALNTLLDIYAASQSSAGEAAFDSRLWQIPADLGVLYAARREYRQAMSYYDSAAAWLERKLKNTPAVGEANLKTRRAASKEAARVQLNRAQCCDYLGRTAEMRGILEYALELDSENLQARLALRRLDERGL